MEEKYFGLGVRIQNHYSIPVGRSIRGGGCSPYEARKKEKKPQKFMILCMEIHVIVIPNQYRSKKCIMERMN